MLNNKRLRAMFGDVTVFWALIPWVARRNDNTDEQTFTFHKKSNYLFILLVVLHEQILEAIAFHFLLHDILPARNVLVLQIIHVYGILYMIGDYNLLRRSRVKINDKKVIIDVALRRCIEFNISNIQEVVVSNNEKVKRASNRFLVTASPQLLKALIGLEDKINCQIVLKKPVQATGFLGLSRKVQYIDLAIDDIEMYTNRISQDVA